jgi:hypothetical protein
MMRIFRMWSTNSLMPTRTYCCLIDLRRLGQSIAKNPSGLCGDWPGDSLDYAV